MDRKERLLRLKEVIERTGIGRSTVYRKIEAGEFPEAYKLGSFAVRWKESEIDAWIAALKKAA